jgi:hypothetical protein
MGKNEECNAGNIKLGEKGLRTISKAERLLHLSLGSTYSKIDGNNIGNDGLELIASNLPKLNWLNVRMKNLKKETTVSMNLERRHLQCVCGLSIRWISVPHILITGGNKLGDEGAIIIAKHLSSIGLLAIGTCNINEGGNNLTEKGAIALSKGLVNLAKLYIGNPHLKQTLTGLARKVLLLSLITFLDSSVCRSVTFRKSLEENNIGDKAAYEIASKLKYLTLLKIGKNGLTEVCRAKLRSALSNIELVGLS